MKNTQYWVFHTITYLLSFTILLINQLKHMKNLAFLFALFLLFGCSDDDSEDTVDPNNTYIEYANAPNSEGQLLSEIYVDSDNATTYVYGKANASGAPLQVESFAYRVENSNKTEFIILDNNQRVSLLYSETNGIKDNIVHSFAYPEEGIVNYIVYDRDWTSMEDTVVDFSTVEVGYASEYFGRY